MKEQTMTHVSEATCTSRVDKYLERIEDKPKNRNQLLIRDGEAILVMEGVSSKCTMLEGYVKLPDEDKFHVASQMDISFFILPKGKLIVYRENQTEFLGFKNENSQECCLLIHAITEYDDILIISLDNNIPLYISVDVVDGDEVNINKLVFMNVEYLLKKVYTSNLPLTDVVEKEGEDDEWE